MTRGRPGRARREVVVKRPAERPIDDNAIAAALWLQVRAVPDPRAEAELAEMAGPKQWEKMHARRLRRVVESLGTDKPMLRSLRPGGLDALLSALEEIGE